MVLKPGREAEAEAIFRKWELDFAVIGEVTDTGRMELEWKGEKVADIPLGPLADEAPLYDRPHLSREEYKAWAQVKPLDQVPESTDIAADLLKLIGSPNLASRRWIFEQYDQQVGGDTVQRPGGDAALVRVHGTDKALAISTDCIPRYCFADPYEGGKQAVAETYRNLSAVGATPLAITNCLNFGNPQRPEIMAQIVGCLQGMADACRALDYPIVSGNVSLYNESKATGGGSAILPTPAIGGVGLLLDWRRNAAVGGAQDMDDIWLVGDLPSHLGQSLWLAELHGRKDGAPPPVDLATERKHAEFIREAIRRELVTAVHDLSDGGLLVAVAEMALASGLGVEFDRLFLREHPATPALLFGEDQGRYLVTTSNSDPLVRAMAKDGIPHTRIGSVGGETIVIGEATVSLADLRTAHEGFLPKLMGGEHPVA